MCLSDNKSKSVRSVGAEQVRNAGVCKVGFASPDQTKNIGVVNDSISN